MSHVFTRTVGVTRFTDVRRVKKDDLRKTLVGIDLRGKRSRVGNLQRNMPFPLRLKGRDIDDDPAASIGGFSQTNRQNVAWNAKILDTSRKSEGIRRDDSHVGLDIHQGPRVEAFRVHYRIKNIGEDLEFTGDP